ncbi:MerR family transcriptional regulator [Bacillus inaquosorum]|uniref:MerR family transcriptional regulator n=1 Tax=Bacillus inaquosorum TaxID=483913 RepID=UPI0022832AAA|nr:MerR family transcriptional regulator [Bacillus inaquosorum]MCY7758130.1 MerR family transcriptional regulator [Bacillus inaquosorum]MCY8492097.1 MerR family transcriptional regulator [Bacillus inaquosorum]MCY8695661.1 MerR family transcriptional regulator [Bacillus inaquosorum]MCY8723239.1 MerR family transcriptional regulator [Bacillus inaquosorum]MCY8731206.1 MerR family transcriptional regulator [Bacillus inaquosorum]
MSNNFLTIGQLAKRTGVTIRTLRYYDKIGLLQPSDYNEGGHRLYSFKDLKRLQQIQSLKFIGFSLKDISDFLVAEQIEKRDITHTIMFKKKQLLAEQEKIQQTIDQLNHMFAILENQQKVYTSIFCFIIHSILWEEENLDELNQIENSIYNFRSNERLDLDKEYFSVFTKLKSLVIENVSPQSNEAQLFIKDFVALNRKTLLKIKNSKDNVINFNKKDQINILDPLTEKEKLFIKEAFALISN